MSHEIDTTDGQSSFVSAREDAWHQLGVTLDHSFTALEAMEFGKLGNWNVRKAPLLAVATTTKYPPPYSEVPVPGQYATIRDNPVKKGQIDVLGTVGEAYRVIQNEAHADLLNTMVDESGAHFETAGALDGGRRVFITMKMPDHIMVGGVDKVDTYLAAINSHDGSAAFTLMVTPIRIVCQNTLNMAYGHRTGMFRVRHTSGADKAMVGEARKTLDLTFAYLEEFQQDAEEMIGTSLTQARFEQIIADEFGPQAGAAANTVTRYENKLDQMVSLFAEAHTQSNIAGTVWAGLNALTEWSDHFSPARGDDRGTVRAQRALLDPSFKNRALKVMMAEVAK